MAIVEATLCLPFKQATQAFTAWQQKVLEACERTGFPYQQEAAEVLSEMEGILVPLLYAQLIESIAVDFGLTEVHFFLRYDAQPDDEDELELALLDLVLEPPNECSITLKLNDLDRAEFLRCYDLEECSSASITVAIAPITEEAQKEEDYGSAC